MSFTGEFTFVEIIKVPINSGYITCVPCIMHMNGRHDNKTGLPRFKNGRLYADEIGHGQMTAIKSHRLLSSHCGGKFNLTHSVNVNEIRSDE